ncbi:MAG TPA: T9SS type A sorting domain-containing protein [Candidatus Kryptonia bacterium]
MFGMKNRYSTLIAGTARSFYEYLLFSFAIAALAVVICARPASAQITSNGTGGGLWTSTSTWAGGVVPDSTYDVVIAVGDSVYTISSTRVTANNIEIQSGAKLNVLGGSSGGTFGVAGAFTIDAGAWFYNSNSSLTGWPNGATAYNIDAASTYVLTAAGSSTVGSSQADSTFGNYIDNKTNGGTSCGANLTIKGDLTIMTGSTSNTFRGISATTAASAGPTLTHHVMGNVKLITGVWSAVDGDLGTGVPMSCTWTIDGNVTIGDPSTASGQARYGPFTSSNANTKYGTFDIGGYLKVINGARLQCGSSSSDNAVNEVGEINLKGDLILDTTAAVAGNTFGKFALNFVGTGTQNITLRVPLGFSQGSTGAYPTFCDTVASGATAVFTGGRPWGRVGGSTPPSLPANGWGAFVVKGTLKFSPTDTLMGNQDFVVAPGGTLGISAAVGVDTSNAGNIQVKGAESFSTAAGYLFNGTTAQVTGNGCPTTMSNLTISDTAGVTLTASDTVSGTLTMNGGGKLNLGTNTILVSGKKTGAVVGDSVSYVIGTLTRADSATGAYLFPIGDGSGYHGVTLNYTAAPTASSNLSASFTAADPTSAGLPAGIGSYWNGGYWTLAASGTPTGTYDLTVYAKGVPNIDTGSVTLIGKPSLAVPWVALNPTATHGSTVSGNLITESGVTTYGIVGVGYGKLTAVKDKNNLVPTTVSLGNYPNPFNPTTDIEFSVPKTARVTLVIYNYVGQKVATLVDQVMNPGVYNRIFDGSTLSSGVYFTRLGVGDKTLVGKMLMIK